MSRPKQYMAGSVPRFLRQTRLSYLPLNCLIGSRAMTSDTGANLVFDTIMLPAPDFQRMKANVGLQHVIAPALQPGGVSFNPAFIVADAKYVTVPPDEPDPEGFARNYFLLEFGFTKPPVPEPPPEESPTFSRTAQECTFRVKLGQNIC